MKQRKTKTLKLFLVLFGITVVIFTCQKEDDTFKFEPEAKNQTSTTKTVSASDIPEVMNFIASKSADYKFVLDDSNTSDGMNRSHENNLVMTTLIIDEITQVTNSKQKSNYTFRLIKQSSLDGKYFLNLVVKEYMDTYYLYIVKYVPDSFWLSSHSITKNLGDFTGMVYFYNDEGVYIAKATMQNGSSTSSERHPCDDPEDDGSGSGDDGAGGGSGCTMTLVWYECNGSNSSIPHSAGSCGGSSGGGSGFYWVETGDCVGNKSMNDFLRHPCEGTGNGGATGGGTPSCTPDPNEPCVFPMQLDQNCDCVEAQIIESNEVAVIFEKPPCARLQNLENDDDFKLVLQDLKNKAATDNHETSYILENTEENNLGFDYFGPYDGGENELGVSLSLDEGYQFASFVHNHNNDNQNRDLSVYSPEDLYALYRFLKDDHIEYTESFFSFVVTNHGTNYALNISDSTAFIAFGDLVFDGWGDNDDDNNSAILIDEYEGINNTTQTFPLGIKNENTAAQNELSFMKILEYPGIDVGLELFKADDTFDNWQKVKLNNGQISYDNPCN